MKRNVWLFCARAALLLAAVLLVSCTPLPWNIRKAALLLALAVFVLLSLLQVFGSRRR